MGVHWRRRHSKPCTPYQRLLKSAKVAEEAKDQLRREFQNLDSFELHKNIEAKLRAIFRLARLRQKPATQTRSRKRATQTRQKTATQTRFAA